MKTLVVVTALAAGVISTIPAYAGKKSTHEVTIARSKNAIVVSGSLESARHSADKIQYITCTLFSDDDPNAAPFVQCSAQSAKRFDAAVCITQFPDPAMIRAVASISSTSLIQFVVGPNSTCSSISVNNQSSNL